MLKVGEPDQSIGRVLEAVPVMQLDGCRFKAGPCRFQVAATSFALTQHRRTTVVPEVTLSSCGRTSCNEVS